MRFVRCESKLSLNFSHWIWGVCSIFLDIGRGFSDCCESRSKLYDNLSVEWPDARHRFRLDCCSSVKAERICSLFGPPVAPARLATLCSGSPCSAFAALPFRGAGLGRLW